MLIDGSPHKKTVVRTNFQHLQLKIYFLPRY